jgi:hypothetical protein
MTTFWNPRWRHSPSWILKKCQIWCWRTILRNVWYLDIKFCENQSNCHQIMTDCSKSKNHVMAVITNNLNKLRHIINGNYGSVSIASNPNWLLFKTVKEFWLLVNNWQSCWRLTAAPKITCNGKLRVIYAKITRNLRVAVILPKLRVNFKH